MADTIREGVQNAFGSVGEKFNSAVDQVSEKTEPIQEGIKDAAQSVADAAVRVKDRVVDATAAGTEYTQQTIESVGQEVSQLVRKYPIAALAIGFGIGLLLGRTANKA